MKGMDTATPVSAPASVATEPEGATALAFAVGAERMRVPDAGAGGSAGLAGLSPDVDGRPKSDTSAAVPGAPYRNRYVASGRRERGPFYAALDLGTNNCRLLVAEPSGETFRIVDSFSRIVRLGEGMAASGSLNPEAMERAFGALRVCSQKLQDRPVAQARLIATEACRRADNGAEFLRRVRDELGIDLEIIDRRTEARLAVEGCFSLLDPEAPGAVLFDIGGGSTEIVWLDRRKVRRRGGMMKAWVSLPLGVVTLAEKFGGVEVTPAVFEAMVAAVQAEFHRFRARDALRKACGAGSLHFLGTSGTVTTLAGVHLELPRYDRRHVDGLWMEHDDIELMMTKIRGMDYEARRSNPCIGRERADLVLAGCAIFEAIRREWPCKRLRVADRGLREGILVQLMRADGFMRGRGSARPESLRAQ